MLSLTVFMLLVAEIMPATSDSVPLIGKARTQVCLGLPSRCMEEVLEIYSAPLCSAVET